MKNIIFLIILLCIAVASFGQSYQYDKILIKQKGNEFGFDNKQIKNQSGTIIVKKDRVSIDFKRYRLKRQISDNLYKTKGGTIEYVYNDAGLQSIRLHKYDMDYHYRIKNDKAVVAGR